MPSLNIIGNVNLTGGKYNPTPFTATGGIENTFVSGGITYKSHTFISGSGSFEILRGETSAQLLVVGGGGGGEFGVQPTDTNFGGNGGGAGGFLYTSSFFLRRNPNPDQRSLWTAIVGAGGSGAILSPLTIATSGSQSSFIASYGYEQIVPAIAYGGGVGPSGSGASGGGENGLAIYGDQGNNGGDDNSYVGAGGGGAGTPGTGSLGSVGGGGGQGRALTLRDGTSQYYAGGGGGGAQVDVPSSGGAGGIGGGGNGAGQLPVAGPGGNGTANTGGGGGGGVNANNSADRGIGGNGGSGIVIITYPVS